LNIILFEESELSGFLDKKDPRAQHILHVLRLGPGDSLDIGKINGPRGRALISDITEQGLCLEYSFESSIPSLYPVILIAGLTRPASAKRILSQATALGVNRMFFIKTDKGENSYSESRLWHGEYRRLLIEGAQQAFCTRLPEAALFPDLKAALTAITTAEKKFFKITLDNYEASIPLTDTPFAEQAVLAVGPERGWSSREREIFRTAGFVLAHMGPRVLKTETACVAGLAFLISRLKGGYNPAGC